jgi:hypothetical protein
MPTVRDMALFQNGPVDAEKIIGMKPEELKAKLDSAVTKDDLKAVGEQVAQFNSGLAELKASLAALTTPKETPLIEDDPTDPTTKVLTDPEKFVRDQTKGLQDGQIQTRAELQEMRARQNPRLRAVFDKYGDEMVASAAKMPLATRAQDGFWEWHARTFVGDKMISGKIDRESYPSLIGSSTISPSSDGKETDPNAGFDPQVAEWLKGRNVPLTKAARIQQIMGRDGDPITIQNYKGGNA